MKICIRADGGSEIGMGHIMRTLVLAKELSKTNEIFYSCRVDNPLTDKYKSGICKIKSENFEIRYLNEDSLIEDLSEIEADCLITDSYDVDKKYFDETKKIFKKTGYIDDMNLYYFNVDFVINQNINAESLEYKTNKDTKLFLGPKYVMLREEFRHAPKKNIKKNVIDILITVGGSDENHITEKILDHVKDLKYNFHVVIGPSFNKLDKLKMIEKENKNIKLYFNANMFKLMQKCDIAVSACGSTLYELAVCKVPTIGISLADNQLEIAKYMKEKKIICYIGYYSESNVNKIREAIEEVSLSYNLRNNMIYNGIKCIRNDGVKNLTNEINKLIKEK